MYDTSTLSPLKGETHQLWPEDISTKALESLFDLDPALEETLDLSEFNTAITPPGVPDHSVVAAPAVTSNESVDLLALTTQHLAQLEGQSAIFTTDQGFAVAAGSHPHQQRSPPPQIASLPTDEVSQAFSEDVFMPEYQSLVAMTTSAPTSTSQQGEWAQTPFYTTVKTEDLTLSSLTACSQEASLPGFTSTPTTTTCKTEPFLQDDSCSQFADLSPAPRSSRSMSESSTATSVSMSDTTRRSSKGGSRRRQVPKGSEEYKEKRARNNVAVRKSRAKAKEKQRTTEHRVKELVDLNDTLQKKVEMLTKELTVLKGLFINVGASLPDDFAKIMEQS